mgnify:CR=1 FL=1
MTDKPASGSKRFWKLASMTAGVSGRLAKSKLQQFFQNPDAAQESQKKMLKENSEAIAQTLGELKGAVMKVGQMASITSDILPAPLAEALKRLQNEAPPVSFKVIEEQIISELGDHPDTLFKDFQREPYAAASIGQVHLARLHDGRQVVVKIQYPGVDDAMDSDLKHLKLTLKASGLLKMDAASMDALFEELKSRLREELDYKHEAENQKIFYDYYRNDNKVIVPELIAERSSSRILTLIHEPGEQFGDLWNDGYPQETIDELGSIMLRMIGEQIFILGAVHADPNPANFACRDDGRVILYDFGCIKRVSRPVIDAYRDTIKAALRRQYPEVEEGLIRLGVRNVDGPPVEHAYYEEWRNLLAEPYEYGGPYNFGKTDLHLRAAQKIPYLITHKLESFKPPVEIAFIDRAVAGLFGNLRLMGAACDVRAIAEPYLFGNLAP